MMGYGWMAVASGAGCTSIGGAGSCILAASQLLLGSLLSPAGLPQKSCFGSSAWLVTDGSGSLCDIGSMPVPDRPSLAVACSSCATDPLCVKGVWSTSFTPSRSEVHLPAQPFQGSTIFTAQALTCPFMMLRSRASACSAVGLAAASGWKHSISSSGRPGANPAWDGSCGPCGLLSIVLVISGADMPSKGGLPPSTCTMVAAKPQTSAAGPTPACLGLCCSGAMYATVPWTLVNDCAASKMAYELQAAVCDAASTYSERIWQHPHHGPAGAVLQHPRQPKVSQHCPAAILQQHVVGLEVHHDDAATVQLGQACQDVAAVPAWRALGGVRGG
jgi:hypothetical protein